MSGVESGLGDLALFGPTSEEFVARLTEETAIPVERFLEGVPRIALGVAIHEGFLEIAHHEVGIAEILAHQCDEADELHLEFRGSDGAEATFECVEVRPEFLLCRCLRIFVECGHGAVVFDCECELVTDVDYSGIHYLSMYTEMCQ